MTDRRPRVGEVNAAQAAQLIEKGAALVDTREQHEWRTGHLPGATLVPPAEVMRRIRDVVHDRDRTVVLYCRSGVRSLFAAHQLAALGYQDVVSLAGGIIAWGADGRPIEAPGAAPTGERSRYSRQLVIEEIGQEGQARLGASKALVVGAGGLGSPALLYLAAVGVGTLGIVDFDAVELSNLHRQVIHTSDRVGTHKVESAARAIRQLNPETRLVEHREMLTGKSVDRLIAGYDVIIDGTDSFEARYVLNDAAVSARIPVVHASVFRFEGQLTVLAPFEGPCYRCLFPSPPPPEAAAGCSVAGVLGTVPGVMGTLQATEAIKLLLGIGEPLIGRMVVWDALAGSFSEMSLRRDPDCPACGVTAARRAEAPE
jgi:sulfur-carrier protein adenylyltransferase/sulfurtransferase